MQKSIKERFDEKWICSMGGCFEWTGSRYPNGYGQMRIPEQKEGYAHRVAWFLSTGEWPKDKHVCHHCDNPGCVRFDHLFLGTRSDNMMDCSIKGRCSRGDVKGESSGMAKLSNSDVRFIRENVKKYGDYSRLGRMFSVAHTTIRSVVNGKTWTHV